MDFGLLLAFRNPKQWARPFDAIYREHIEQAELAEALGYDTIWTTEHHFAEDGWSPSLLPILSAIAARTRTIRIGTFIIVLPFHHPVRVAEDAATVDIISGGRLDLGVGQGYWLSEFASFGISRRQRVSRVVEGVEIIEKCFTEPGFSYAGKYWQLRDIELSPRPIQQPGPPIWIAAMAENSVRRVARMGYHLAGSGGGDLQRYYDDELVKLGRNIEDHKISQLRAVYVAETREQAWDDCEQYLHYMMSLYDHRFKEADDMEWGSAVMSAPVVPPIGELRKAAGISFFQAPLIVGTPDDAIAEIERYTAETRCTHLVMWMQMAGMPAAKARKSMELFAREVMPHFR
ncbi:MAG: LLM class flavin-dependent oxidoreductase [Gammaproteobacteria bacterium]|nr:LLM class flavin-dependent oxidoreductase [Gammaproteobacteria bacterium]MBI5617791.1 LLM class flavin-dependent oxidoreductase [Gammaproteobacteria bacterium]